MSLVSSALTSSIGRPVPSKRLGSRTADNALHVLQNLASNRTWRRLTTRRASVCRQNVQTDSYAAGAVHTTPSVTCRTVVTVKSPDDMQLILMSNDLVAETFYTTSSNALYDAVSFNSYRLRSCAQTLGLHMGLGRNHATVVAVAGTEQHQQAWKQQQSTQQQAVGVVNVTMMQASATISAATSCKPGTPFAMITNMAVSPPFRRRGIAHLLMQAALSTALVDLDHTPAFAMLLAYKYYSPALTLYEAWGFEHTSWQDPLWLADAEKGKVGRQRRVMMVKELSGPGLLETPLSLA